MNTQWIEIAPGFDGYLALPPTGKGPAVLLIQEIFGVNAHIRGVAEQYAMDGYVVLAPDIYWRAKPRIELGYDDAGVQEGFAHMQRIGLPQLVADLGTAANILRARPEVTGPLASIGYCMGGALSYLLATAHQVDGAVCYYGGGIQDMLDKAAEVQCPMLLHYGQNDSHIPMEAVELVSKATKTSGATLHVYPDVGHGFNCWARGSYDQKAAALARSRTLAFLAEL